MLLLKKNLSSTKLGIQYIDQKYCKKLNPVSAAVITKLFENTNTLLITHISNNLFFCCYIM